jgi:hypothetical protein
MIDTLLRFRDAARARGTRERFGVDDFRRLELVRGRKRTTRTRHQDTGHRSELRAFVDLATGGAPSALTPLDGFSSSALTLQVPAALGLERAVVVDLPAALGGWGADVGSAG